MAAVSTRDTTNANWARTLKRLRRNASELAGYDWQVIEPPNVEIPPKDRLAPGNGRRL
jgi:hypothetical protein